jgi:hypothetical protein
MEKAEIINLYIKDLKAHVSQSDARDNRIGFLEEELKRITSDNSDYVKCREALEEIADYGGSLTGEDAIEMKHIAVYVLSSFA